MRVPARLWWLCAAALSGFGPVTPAAGDDAMVAVGPAAFETAVPPSPADKTVRVPRFEMDVVPVSNARFLAFVRRHPEWRRDRVSGLFADDGYLAHWAGADTLTGPDQALRPVVRVSWFSAGAYCESRGARLPRWYEWELAAAADDSKAYALDDPQWRQRILGWYSRPASAGPIPAAGETPANYYGIRDLHGVIWEWVEDYNGVLVSADNREQGGADKLRFCGAGALSMEQKEHYAVLMRVAMLSSLQARNTTRNLGFRCARDTEETAP
jgi:formylglycine-generating enzyme required for sulfatase activity